MTTLSANDGILKYLE